VVTQPEAMAETATAPEPEPMEIDLLKQELNNIRSMMGELNKRGRGKGNRMHIQSSNNGGRNSKLNRRTLRNGNLKCYKCNGYGHMAKDCASQFNGMNVEESGNDSDQ
jgi:hypothetical protein